MSTNIKKPNRLINEKSPYLLQHAHNPVDWHPWSDFAFAKAKREDKPVFLSIGYSTCHWCHVMERESFEDEEVAAVLNENFVSIKVDREERPDVDHIYMNVCQTLTGSGGWPLTIIMTPDRKPFFAGTYFPKSSRMGYTGLTDILAKVGDIWKQDRKQLLESSEKIMDYMHEESRRDTSGSIGRDIFDRVFRHYSQAFDGTYGGFGPAPKFPSPHNLSLLLRYWKTTGKSDALRMVEQTIQSMYRGGIYDHVGFGFSRYSTDKKWLVPHFEKMLYDNALIAIACIETYQVTKNKAYAEIARQIFGYVLREMQSPEGGFYSAEDADSEGVEGKFYVWEPEEIISVLGDDKGKAFCEYYGIKAGGNFEGKSIPNLIENKSIFENYFTGSFEESREKLFQHRDKRVHPYKDDKILTSWNGLMIAAMAYGARVLESDEYLEAARRAAGFILQELRREDGRLLARYRDGEAAFPAYLDDYAFLIWGLIELYEATFYQEYLKTAIELTAHMLSLFHDDENGGFYIYGSDSEQLIARPKELYDGAIPSGNSVAALDLLRLARLTGNSEYEELAHGQFDAFAGSVDHYPAGYPHFLMAFMFAAEKGSEIIIAGNRDNKDTESMLRMVNGNFLPFSVFAVKEPEEDELAELIPFVEGQQMVDGKTTAYICENFACRAPITDINEFNQILSQSYS